MSLNECRLIELPKINDVRGSLSFAECGKHVPFEFRRVFYMYDIQNGERRGAHALKQCHQFLIPVAGSFKVLLDDGFRKQEFCLEGPNYGLYVPPLIWRELYDFSAGTACLVLASEFYDEDDYYRVYSDFLAARK